MQNISQKILWIGFILAVALGLIWQFYPLQSAKQRLEELPLSGAGFEGQNISLTPQEIEIFKTIDLIKRMYKIGNQRCFLYALDGTHNRHLVHDPTYCFRGDGWQIEKETPFPLPKGTANLDLLAKEQAKREVLYWFSNGSLQYTSPMKYWWQTTLRRLTLGWSGPEPVLIVIQPINKAPLNWKELIEKFPAISLL